MKQQHLSFLGVWDFPLPLEDLRAILGHYWIEGYDSALYKISAWSSILSPFLLRIDGLLPSVPFLLAGPSHLSQQPHSNTGCRQM